MARYIREVQLERPADFVEHIMNDFLYKHGFALKEFKGQMIYRAGGGFFEIPKFLIWSYQNGIFHVEAWTRNLWLPGVYGGENAMTGYIACLPKSAYKKDIEQLIGLLFQPLPDSSGMSQGQTGMPQGQGGGTIYVQGVDMDKYAVIALVCALIGLVLAFLSPILGFLLGGVGIAYGRKGGKSSKSGMANTGLALGIAALVLSVLIYLFQLILLFV